MDVKDVFRPGHRSQQGAKEGVRMTGQQSGTNEPPISKAAAEATSGRAPTLPTGMSGKASPAKAAFGDVPVFAYIASLPQPQRGIAEAVDALAARTLFKLHRS